MTGHGLMVGAVVLLCGYVFVVAGCSIPKDLSEPSTATTTAAPTVAEQSTTTAETAQLYPVSVDGKWGFIDKTGTIKIEPQFVQVHDFSGGLAVVEIATNNGAKSGYIDTSGAMVIEPQFDYAGAFSEGLAAVGNKTGMDGELSGEFGYINTSGVLVIPMERSTASAFSEGLAMFTVMDVGYPSYFIDKTGATVLGPFDFALNFSEGLAYVEWGDRCGYIDKTGDRVIEPQFDWAGGFSEGLAAVSEDYVSDAVTYGYIDKSGTMVIPPRQGTGAEPFSGGVAALTGLGSVANFQSPSYIDKTGKVIWQGK